MSQSADQPGAQQHNAEKDPSQWVTGDQPSTGPAGVLPEHLGPRGRRGGPRRPHQGPGERGDRPAPARDRPRRVGPHAVPGHQRFRPLVPLHVPPRTPPRRARARVRGPEPVAAVSHLTPGGRGAASAEQAWERYAQVAYWSRWSPQIRSVTCSSPRIRTGSTGRVRAVLGVEVDFVVDSVAETARDLGLDRPQGAVDAPSDPSRRPGGGGLPDDPGDGRPAAGAAGLRAAGAAGSWPAGATAALMPARRLVPGVGRGPLLHYPVGVPRGRSPVGLLAGPA